MKLHLTMLSMVACVVPITDTLQEFLELGGRKVVPTMGGHSMQRDVALLTLQLTKESNLLVSRAVLGAMEATHLGAWFCERSDEKIEAALTILFTARGWRDFEWLAAAF